MALWSTGAGMNAATRCHTVRAGDTHLAILLCDGGDIPSTNVHWLHEHNTSIPCEGDTSCPYHDRQLIWKGYPPVLLFRHTWKHGASTVDELTVHVRRFDYSKWWRRALEITQNVRDLCDIGKRGSAFIIQRPSFRRNAPVEFQPINHPLLPLPEALNFDPRPVMEACFNRDLVTRLKIREVS
jgi:hypothetical protein